MYFFFYAGAWGWFEFDLYKNRPGVTPAGVAGSGDCIYRVENPPAPPPALDGLSGDSDLWEFTVERGWVWLG